VLAVLAFAWLELVDVHRDDPRRLGLLALIYALVQLLGMGAFGIEAWSTRGDGFGAAFSLYGRIAPVTTRDRRVFTRRPLNGLARLTDPPVATAALVCTLIGATGFDGFSNSALWGETGVKLIQNLIDSGWSFSASTELVRGAGLVLAVLLTYGLYRLGAGSAKSAQAYAPSLVPIALGYLLAHYFSLLVTQIQGVPLLVAHPLGPSVAPHLDPKALSTATIWYVQFAALLAGHVAGLVVAHERALVLHSGDPRAAGRSQRGLLCVMVAFTCAGLYILSAVST
jgi:hypothetical protein